MSNFWWTIFFWTSICMFVFYQWDTVRNPVKKKRKKKTRSKEAQKAWDEFEL